MADKIKLGVAVLLLAAAIVAFYYFAEYSTLLRTLALLGVVGVAIAVAATTATGRSVWVFVGDSRTEVRKVVWPTGKETWQTTMIVMLMVMIAGVFLWLLDMLLATGVKWLTGQGG